MFVHPLIPGGIVISSRMGSGVDFLKFFNADPGVNLGAVSIDAGNERKILSLASVALGIGVTDRFGAFLEFFTEIPQSESWQPVLDGGFTYLLTPASQFDLYLGKGLNNYTPDFIVGAGFSFRFGY